MINSHNVYRVGDQLITNKTLALIEATKQRIHPEWDYNGDVYGKIDWSSPINEPLEILYRDRCQQLRDKYDYLILSYSGGADSWTILNTFLKYNIQIDEIFTHWPIEGSSGVYTPSTDKASGNILSEWDFVLKPDLENLRSKYPKIKLTVYDYSKDLINKISESQFQIGGHYLNIGFFHRNLANSSIRRSISDNKKIGIIYGCDKPQICIQDGSIYSYFIDMLVSTSPRFDAETNQYTEMFYWGREFPKIAIKGAQLVAEYIKHNPVLHPLFNIHKKFNPEEKKIINKIIKSIVYPDWDDTKFQADKPTNSFVSETDTWIKSKYGNEKFFTDWVGNINEYINTIDPKYFNYDLANNRTSFIGFISPLYKVATL